MFIHHEVFFDSYLYIKTPCFPSSFHFDEEMRHRAVLSDPDMRFNNAMGTSSISRGENEGEPSTLLLKQCCARFCHCYVSGAV